MFSVLLQLPQRLSLIEFNFYDFFSSCSSNQITAKILLEIRISQLNPRKTRFGNGTQVKPCRSGLTTGWVTNRECRLKGP